MADDIIIDKQTFHGRLSNLISQWKSTSKGTVDSTFDGVRSIVICVGKASEGSYSKSAAFQLWLLGYEFPSTLMILTLEKSLIVTTKKKASYLEPLASGKNQLKIIVRGKNAEVNLKQFESCVDFMRKTGGKIGLLLGETPSGPFAEEWAQVFEANAKNLDTVDISNAISIAALSIKDEKELRAIRDASRASSGLTARFFLPKLTSIVDEERVITHKALADRVRAKLDDNAFFEKLKVSADFDAINLDWVLEPVVQSGLKFDLTLAKPVNEERLTDDVVIFAVGLRYQTYSSIIARSYLVDPSKTQESAYKLLVKVYDVVLSKIRDGVVAKDVYQAALDTVKSSKLDYENHFVNSVGYGIGIEFMDSSLVLDSKNTRTLQDGMTLAITIGFKNLDNTDGSSKKPGKFSLLLVDTVRVAVTEAIVFTKDAPTSFHEVSLILNDEKDATPRKKTDTTGKNSAVAKSNFKSTRLRNERQATLNEAKEAARIEHQRQLHAKKLAEGLERYGKGSGSLSGTLERKIKRFESYKRDNQLPSSVKDLRVMLDANASSIIVPIMGRPVPFHINTVKNASTAAEGESMTLRINFLTPGQGVGRKDDQPFEDPSAQFLRSLTFRSTDRSRLESLAMQITELKKEATRREQERKQLEDVVEQDKLIVAKDRRFARLDQVFLRPPFDSKRVSGLVEIHQNGLRYIHEANNAIVDVLFSNVKHLFFQPCTNELIAIIHLHLINPIMIGKKKTKDVQFYREAMEIQIDETGTKKRRRRHGDEEEYQMEQEERRRRNELDKEFYSFTKKIEEAARSVDIHADIPMRELGFNGVPCRSSVWMQPTTDCLVQLTEPPFFVVTLSDVEIVHLERVQFGLKNFDMVIVFRDFNRPPAHINTIPVESLDAIKDWLDSVEVPFSEGPLNLNWTTIMKTVTANPHQFFADGGWSFLTNESDSEDGSESEEESAFELSESELYSEESSEDDSEFDENASDQDSGSASGEYDEEDDGEDWDELDRKAAKKGRETAATLDKNRKKRK